MGRVRDIPRTAAFAWSSSLSNLSLATGTRAGAVDADFSSDITLELWDLDIKDQKRGADLQPVGSLTTDARFYDLVWSEPTSDRPEGIIAGALENGSLDLWDAARLRSSSAEARISRTEKHSGAIKALQFNPHRPELLATAGAKGELYVTDLNNADNPFRLGQANARPEDYDALDWNKQVAHIMATGGSNGFVTVWDVKAKKESLTLNNYGRKPVSAVAWNPDLPTKLATAVPSDQDPLILMWDLRNSSAPERILKGHDQGVLSLSWCQQDSSLLLSCGKDNRNICWNPHTGDMSGEFSIVTNWTFQTRWHPRQPNFLATSSFDGKIGVKTIQNTNTDQDGAAPATAADGAEFFDKAHGAPTGASFSLANPPKWLKRPAGAAFGFGGKLVSFNAKSEDTKSKASIATFASDPSVEKSISGFAEALKNDDLEAVCKEKVEASDSDDSKRDWQVMQTLVSESPRKGLLAYLGFSDEPKKEEDKVEENHEQAERSISESQMNGSLEVMYKKNRSLSVFFAGGDDQNFLADLAASKGAKTNNPFRIFTGSESDAEKRMTRALMLGDFDEALDVCLEENRMSDAFMIAICGGQKCIDKAQAAYFAQQSNGPNYLRLLASIVGKDLWDVVYNANLDNWMEVMATLCTFADETEFPDLCEALGDRLEEDSAIRKHASFCYLAGSKLDKVLPIWLNEAKDLEKARVTAAEEESAFSVHVQALQYLIEKVSVFRKATAYVDKEGQTKSSDWRLEPLYAKYAEYADVVGSYGHLDLADQYLSLLPSQYPGADVARTRVSQASRKQSVVSAKSQTRATPSRQLPIMASSVPAQPSAPLGARTAGAARSAYAPPAFQQQQQQQPQQHQQQQLLPTPSPYAPANAFSNSYQPPGQPSQLPVPPPPTSSGPPPSGPALTRAQANGTNWNDLPESFQRKPPVSRTGTPGMGGPSMTSPFPGQPGPQPYPPNALPQKTLSPLPPPPKAGSTPSRVNSPPTGALPAASRPGSSSAASHYAPLTSPPPLPTSNYGPPTSIPPRGQSPYNAPPAAPPPTNRYAPAPGSVSPSGPASYGPPGGNYGPPPGVRQAVPSPYAPQMPPQQPTSNYGPPPQQPPSSNYGPPQHQMPTLQSPGQGPSPASKPPVGPPPRGSRTSQTGPLPPTSLPGSTSTAKLPAGDRTHMSPTSQQTYKILSTEISRIKGLAPAKYKSEVEATEKRINEMFDALNNGEIDESVAGKLGEMAEAVRRRDFEAAIGIHGVFAKTGAVGGSWMMGLKRLISMSKLTPVS